MSFGTVSIADKRCMIFRNRLTHNYANTSKNKAGKSFLLLQLFSQPSSYWFVV